MRPLVFLFILVGVPLGLLACTYVARDMDRRGLDGRIYGAITFFCFPAGIVVWLVQRVKHPVRSPD